MALMPLADLIQTLVNQAQRKGTPMSIMETLTSRPRPVVDVCNYLVERYSIRSVIDIGCGRGEHVSFMRSLGVTAFGITNDPVQAALPVCKWVTLHDFTKAIPNVIFQGGQKPNDTIITYSPYDLDMAFSYNFLGTLPWPEMSQVIDPFYSTRKVVAFTHEPEGRGKSGQDAQHWIDMMKRAGFIVDELATNHSRKLAGDSLWAATGLIFVKE